MAGHNFSRYMSSLWSALFAPFNFFYTRLWPFFAQALALEGTNIVSLPFANRAPSPLHTTTSSSFFIPPDATFPTPPPPKSQSSPGTITNSFPPSISASNLHNQNSSHSTAGDGIPDHTVANDNLDGWVNSTVTGHTVDLASEDDPQPREQSLDMTRKRAGRGRGGARAAVHRPIAVTPVIPVTPVDASQSENNASGHTSFTPSHINSSNLTSFGRGDSLPPNRNSPLPHQQPVGDRKENAAPQKTKNPVSPVTPSYPSDPTSLAVTDKTNQPQGPGTGSHPEIRPSNTVPTITTMGDGCPHSSSDPEQLHVIADRLTLDDAPSCQTPVQQTLNAAINTAEVSALPVPLLVTAPVPPELQRAQSEPETPSTPILPGLIEPTTDEERAEREYHLTFMREALEMGDLALKTNETPVGCVLVYKGRTIARGMNATNITRNGTRHAEFMALSALLSRRELGDVRMANNNPDLDDASWGDVDPKDGHIYPYGQKLHPAPIVNRSIISDCVLYVTVEPCVMCASLLRQLGIKKVYFGAVNDKFGGTGGVFRVHMNSKPVVLPKDRPYQLGYGPQDLHLISKGRAVALPRDEDDGDGGNVESGYPVEGGYLRDDAVSLLRRFYVQENGRAPQPRKKEGRAARLYAALGVGATETGAAETGAAETDAAETGAAETGAMESATINTATIETNTVKAVNMETKNGAADAPDLYDNSTETLVDADPLTHGS